MPELIEKELKEITRIIAGVKRHAEENDPALDRQLKQISEIFSDFSRKYPQLTLKLDKTIDSIIPRIFINDSLRNIFDETASNIKSLAAIGLHNFDEAGIRESDKFSSLVDGMKDKVFLTYTTDTGTETLALHFNKKENKTELNYEIKSLANPLTPQFQLLKAYAGKEANPDTDFLHKCYSLGFIDIEDDALFEWEDEFYPKMLD
ncbi:hypothetical protein GF323_05215 [Candidatus Woesearchaeota archaeon]|nr:hypothetical protein [Candidatus Woesearchaeota archaeon]